jgi:tripartite-type tricarboxylate transporter receptor subunit TctC
MREVNVTKIMSLMALGVLLIATVLPGIAEAEDYPVRPVRIIIPGTAGGGIDFTARLLAGKLMDAFGSPFVVENRDGASGNIATGYVARAQPDGYTLLLTISGFHVTNPGVFPSLQWDPLRDFSGVAMVMRAPHVLVVSTDLRVSSFDDLVRYAAANPSRVTYASPGVGTQSQIASELLAQTQHIQIRGIPYRGTALAMNDIMAGSVDMLITTTQSLMGPLQGNAIKGLAILDRNRDSLLPNIPSIAELDHPELEMNTWYALYAPAGTSKQVRARLAAAIKTISEDKDFNARVRQSGGTTFYLGPDELDDYTARELTRWTNVVHKLGITIQ